MAIEALPALIGAVGFVGFIALVGGAIEWTRFWAADLPADQAVRVIPRTELVTIGAVSTIVSTILGLLALLLVYFLDPRGTVSARTRRGLLFVACGELAAIAVIIELETWQYVLFFAWGALLAVTAYRPLERAASTLGPVLDEPPESAGAVQEAFNAERARYEAARARYDEAQDAWKAANTPREQQRDPTDIKAATRAWVHEQDEWQRARLRWLRVGSSLETRLREAREWEQETKRARDSVRFVGKLITELRLADLRVLAVLAVGVIVIVASDSTHEFAYLLPVPVVLFVCLLGIARATQGFAWYGVAVFLSVPVFGAILAIADTHHTPQVQPLALVRKSDDRALCGIYITQTDDRLYVGRVELDDDSDRTTQKDSGRIFSIPLDDVDVVSVGPWQRISDAQYHVHELVKEVYAIRAQEQPTEVGNTITVVESQTEKTGRTPAGGGTPPTTTEKETKTSEVPVHPRPRPSNRPDPSPRRAECPGVDVTEAPET